MLDNHLIRAENLMKFYFEQTPQNNSYSFSERINQFKQKLSSLTNDFKANIRNKIVQAKNDLSNSVKEKVNDVKSSIRRKIDQSILSVTGKIKDFTENIENKYVSDKQDVKVKDTGHVEQTTDAIKGSLRTEKNQPLQKSEREYQTGKEVTEGISDLKVLKSAAGFYIGREFTDEDKVTMPYNRESGYFQDRAVAEKELAARIAQDPIQTEDSLTRNEPENVEQTVKQEDKTMSQDVNNIKEHFQTEQKNINFKQQYAQFLGAQFVGNKASIDYDKSVIKENNNWQRLSMRQEAIETMKFNKQIPDNLKNFVNQKSDEIAKVMASADKEEQDNFISAEHKSMDAPKISRGVGMEI